MLRRTIGMCKRGVRDCPVGPLLALGVTANTLRSEVTDFLAAMSQGDDAERRLYERIPAGGVWVSLQIGGRPGIEAMVEDISRGGMGLKSTVMMKPALT